MKKGEEKEREKESEQRERVSAARLQFGAESVVAFGSFLPRPFSSAAEVTRDGARGRGRLHAMKLHSPSIARNERAAAAERAQEEARGPLLSPPLSFVESASALNL